MTLVESSPGDAASMIMASSTAVLDVHRGGKLRVRSTVDLGVRAAMSMAYTPGVADVSTLLHHRPALAYDYTWKGSTVAVVTDGTAVLGLGDIGPLAALPVMEGKCALFAHFAGINAVPICLDTTDVDEIVDTVVRLAPGFGGINLEDISAPRCFEVERRLLDRLDIPVFHDDQHGTAIVVLAAMINAAKVVGKSLGSMSVVVHGAGAAGSAVAGALLDAGLGDVVVTDRGGALHPGRSDLGPAKAGLAARTNRRGVTGSVEDVMVGADAFVGVAGGRVAVEAVARMGRSPIVLSLANPVPEVDPVAARAVAAVVGTGRSDHPNQVNNVLAFPGVFAGALQAHARSITPAMRLAAAGALAELVGDSARPDHVVPEVFDARVVPAVAAAVAAAAGRPPLA